MALAVGTSDRKPWCRGRLWRRVPGASAAHKHGMTDHAGHASSRAAGLAAAACCRPLRFCLLQPLVSAGRSLHCPASTGLRPWDLLLGSLLRAGVVSPLRD